MSNFLVTDARPSTYWANVWHSFGMSLTLAVLLSSALGTRNICDTLMLGKMEGFGLGFFWVFLQLYRFCHTLHSQDSLGFEEV